MLRPTTGNPGPTRSRQRRPRVLTSVYLVALLAPLTALGTAYALSIRSWMVLGSWPRPWLDDPKFIAPHDPVTAVLYWLVLAALLWSFVSLLVVAVLMEVLSRSTARRWLSVGLVLYGSGWLLLWLDPGARLMWYFD